MNLNSVHVIVTYRCTRTCPHCFVFGSPDNDQVMTYNTSIQQIPRNIVAGIGGFTPSEFFEIKVEQERQAPKVDFS